MKKKEITVVDIRHLLNVHIEVQDFTDAQLLDFDLEKDLGLKATAENGKIHQDDPKVDRAQAIMFGTLYFLTKMQDSKFASSFPVVAMK